MKKLLVILCLVLLAGCVTNAQIVLARSQIYVGMKIMDIWKLYGFLPGDVNKVSELIPQFVNQPLSEQENNECETSIYRYWLTQNGSKLPFLLTFQSCRLPNYDAVQKEKERFINDPNFKEVWKELDAFCKENKVDSKNKEVLIEVLINNYYSTNGQPLISRCVTARTLIAINPDKSKLDSNGSKPEIGSISKDTVCRKTTKETLKTEKKIHENQKKALKKQKQKPFNVQDLKLGMYKEQVELICYKGSLEFIATEAIPDSNGYSKAVYRMWPKKTNRTLEQIASRSSVGAAFVQAGNKDNKPYQLTFIVAPPFTKEQITEYVKQKNITDPNELALLGSLEGWQYSQLIGVSQDMGMIELQAIQQAQWAQQRQGRQQNFQMQQTNQNLEQIRMQNFQRQSQEDFYRMQRNR